MRVGVCDKGKKFVAKCSVKTKGIIQAGLNRIRNENLKYSQTSKF